MYRNLILPASILAGTIIGAGIFSLPFVFVRAGFLTGLFYLAVFSLIYILIYFAYADIIIKTPGEHRLVGYAKIYFGQTGFWIAIFVGLIQLIFVLTVYLILAPSFSRLFLSGDYSYHLIGFWVLGSLVILFNTRRIAFLEFLMVAGILAVIAVISALGFPEFAAKKNWDGFDPWKLLVIGPIIFALAGDLAVPEVISYFKELGKPLSFVKPALAVGALVPAVAYAGFVMGTLGISQIVSEDAVSGLVGLVPIGVLTLIGMLGFFSLMSSYIVVGLNVRRILEYDLCLSPYFGRLLIVIAPFLLYLVGFRSFLGLVNLLGTVFFPIGIGLIVLIWLKVWLVSN